MSSSAPRHKGEHSVKPIRDSGKSVPIFRPIRLAASDCDCDRDRARPHHRHIFHFIDLLASSSSLPLPPSLHNIISSQRTGQLREFLNSKPNEVAFRCFTSKLCPSHQHVANAMNWRQSPLTLLVYRRIFGGAFVTPLLIISLARSVARSVWRRCEKEKEKPRVTEATTEDDE